MVPPREVLIGRFRATLQDGGEAYVMIRRRSRALLLQRALATGIDTHSVGPAQQGTVEEWAAEARRAWPDITDVRFEPPAAFQ